MWHRQYLCNEEVKQVVISVHELDCSRIVYRKDVEAYGDSYLSEMKDATKRELAIMLEEFIGVQEIGHLRPGGTELKATIYMPYVRDHLLKKAEEKIKKLKHVIRMNQGITEGIMKQTSELVIENAYLKLPFWKRWSKAIQRWYKEEA